MAVPGLAAIFKREIVSEHSTVDLTLVELLDCEFGMVWSLVHKLKSQETANSRLPTIASIDNYGFG